ncbi:DUF6906 family protein [Gottfriedia sp. NPDC058432]|uniref:DUF6906 family protein n=1 Tax=Gottfriedia sp. NPDC058432 TaxID=3346497 RepID=UPI003662E165
MRDIKQGKRPTKRQAILIRSYGFKHGNWLIVKNLLEELHIAHRETGSKKVLPST